MSIQVWKFGASGSPEVQQDFNGSFSTEHVYVVKPAGASLFVWDGEDASKEARAAAAQYAAGLVEEDTVISRQAQKSEGADFKQLFASISYIAPQQSSAADTGDGDGMAEGDDDEEEATAEGGAPVQSGAAKKKRRKKKNKGGAVAAAGTAGVLDIPITEETPAPTPAAVSQEPTEQAPPSPAVAAPVAVAEKVVEKTAEVVPAAPTPVKQVPESPKPAASAGTPASPKPATPASVAKPAAEDAAPVASLAAEVAALASPKSIEKKPVTPAPAPASAEKKAATPAPAAAVTPKSAEKPANAASEKSSAKKATPNGAATATPKTAPKSGPKEESESVKKAANELSTRLSGTFVDPLTKKQEALSKTYLIDSAKAWGGTGAAPAGSPAPVEIKIKPGAKFFPHAELKDMKVESGIDMTCKEEYLGDEEFAKVFGKDRAAFKAQPAWRQQLQKKDVGLW